MPPLNVIQPSGIRIQDIEFLDELNMATNNRKAYLDELMGKFV